MNNKAPEDQFLTKLRREAKQQAKLERHPWLPKHLDWFTSLVGSYPWQILLAVSLISALIWEWFQSS